MSNDKVCDGCDYKGKCTIFPCELKFKENSIDDAVMFHRTRKGCDSDGVNNVGDDNRAADVSSADGMEGRLEDVQRIDNNGFINVEELKKFIRKRLNENNHYCGDAWYGYFGAMQEVITWLEQE